MTKSTAAARAWRTFLFLLASSGAFAALAQTDWFEDYRSGAIALGVAVLTAGLGALSAFLLAYSEWWQTHVQTPLARAAATAVQQLALGLAAISIVNIDPDVVVDVGKQIGNLIGAAVITFVITFGTNKAEDNSIVSEHRDGVA